LVEGYVKKKVFEPLRTGFNSEI